MTLEIFVCERMAGFSPVFPVLQEEEGHHLVPERLPCPRDVPDQVLWEGEENGTKSRLALDRFQRQVFRCPKSGCYNNDDIGL